MSCPTWKYVQGFGLRLGSLRPLAKTPPRNAKFAKAALRKVTRANPKAHSSASHTLNPKGFRGEAGQVIMRQKLSCQYYFRGRNRWDEGRWGEGSLVHSLVYLGLFPIPHLPLPHLLSL